MMADKLLDANGVISLLKGKSYKWAQVHHTYKPNHGDFTGGNYQSLQDGMRNYHVNTRGWQDIGQHLTLYPDGMFLTGRNFNIAPAGIAGYNTGAFMIEIIGDFDKGKDKLEGKQLNAGLKVYQYLVNHCGATIMFHNEKASKTCPGTGVDKAKFVKAVKNFDGKTPDVSSKGSSSGGSSSSSGSKSKWTTITGSWTGQTLKKGHHGNPVTQLQKLVSTKADSYYGVDTVKAVKKAQKKAGIAVDGMAGKDTYKAVKSGKSSKGKSSNMSIDGKWGVDVTKGLQRVFNTPVDGKLSGQSRNAVTNALYSNTANFGSGGSVVIKALQKKLGVAADGLLGPATIRALQKRMGTPVDGKLSKVSPMIKELQKRLNKGKM